MEHDAEHRDYPGEDDHFVYGPTNPEEEELYQLILEGINSGPGEIIDIDEYFARLNARILGKK